MASVLPDPATPFGARVAHRLEGERLIWLVTVAADGTPQPNPVWFLWDGTSALIYSLRDAARLAHIRRNPRVALHFDSHGQGGDIVVLTGDAAVGTADPPADQNAAFVEKYRDAIAGGFGTPEQFAAKYSVPVRVTPSKVRGF